MWVEIDFEPPWYGALGVGLWIIDKPGNSMYQLSKDNAVERCLSIEFWMISLGITTTIGKGCKYNDWEKISIKTTTNGIQIVVVKYNGWEMAR